MLLITDWSESLLLLRALIYRTQSGDSGIEYNEANHLHRFLSENWEANICQGGEGGGKVLVGFVFMGMGSCVQITAMNC